MLNNGFGNNSFNGGFGNNGSNLPYPADQLVRNPINININNPPFVPQVNCTNELRQYLPVIAGSLIGVIQNGAQQSNLRAFAFNVLSENNYANQEFAQLVATAVNIVMVHAYMQNQGNDAQALINYATNKSLDLYMAFNVSRFPALQQYINAEQAQQIQALLNEGTQYQQKFNQLNQQLQYGGSNQFNQRPSFSQSGIGMNNQPIQNSFGNNSGSSVFSSGPNSNVNESTTVQMENRYTSRYAQLHEQEIADTPVIMKKEQTVTLVEQPQTDVPENYKTSDLVWSSLEDQPYPPIVKFSENEIKIKRDLNNKPKLFIENRSENSVFDYQTHTALSSLRVFPSTETRLTNQEIRQTNENIAKIISEGSSILDLQMIEDGSPVPIFKIIEYPNYLMENSLDSAFFESEVTREKMKDLLSLDDEQTLVFITNSYIIENIGKISEVEEKEIDFLYRSKTLDELHSRLKASAASLSKKAWRTIESRITKFINNVLRLQLAMDIKIDSFLTDYEDLKSVLESKGETIYDSFKMHQKELITYVLNVENDPKIIKTIDATFLSDDADKESGINFKFLSNETSVVNISMSCEELNVDVYKDLGSLIVERESKVLYKLAHHLFTRIPKNQFFTDLYVLTTDGVALRITRGLIGEEQYTLSVAKK